MPAIIGPVQIYSISDGIVQFGDSAFISPKNSGKTSAGSGGFNTGPFIVTYTGFNANPTFTCSGVDQPIVGNN
ncbi:spore germination protein PF [Oikeobacillus pervagus]|uniref:Spore germination protein PF n=1 Tax=Oikeobacillus pervagus TaxID=1325931 RepID=A0AAJ1WIM4_9BACI|nr:spore germination protein [Oikeobacillus pervagus]MDQ0214785.1 spore germination protein PF [Oikeobacillus pervagus]